MNIISERSGALVLLAMLAVPTSASLAAQEPESTPGAVQTTVYGVPPADLTGLAAGPDIEGIISARSGYRMQVTSEDGTRTAVDISEATQIKGSGGFLGLNSKELAAESLLNGLPVSLKTVQWNGGLVASQIKFRNNDFKTASMIRNGTAQGFAEQTAATEALRGRMGDIDKYNIKSTTNVYFDTGKWQLSGQARDELCAAASQAEGMDNALLLVVGYTDSVGNEDYNQVLSERRASRVVNYLQQACGWKPYRMLTPTGMSEADPLASNDTIQGKAQNRRVSVNILVSKGLDGL